MAVIIQAGMREMFAEQADVFYYITVMNENYLHPKIPKGVEQSIIDGMYLLSDVSRPEVELLGSGTLLREAEQAAVTLNKLGIRTRVWSITSWSEVARQCEADPEWLNKQFKGKSVIGVSDYVRAVPGLLRAHIASTYVTLGTDGFGLSDTRQRLRTYFGVDAPAIIDVAKQSVGYQD